MICRVFDLVACTCAVTAPSPVHDVLDRYLTPFLAESPTLQADVSLSVHCEPPTKVMEMDSAFAGLVPTEVRRSHPDQRYLVWRDGPTQRLVPEVRRDHTITVHHGHVEISAADVTRAARVTVRVVRQVIMRGCEVQGGRGVHAAVVVIDGHGILIGGQPGAGKTSVLTQLIERHGACPVANDRAVLMTTDGRTWLAVGVPLAWRFTPEGLRGSARLAAGYAATEPRRGRALVDGKHELTPSEVSILLGQPHRASNTIQEIVLLSRAPNSDHASLRAHLDFGDADFFAEDWLGILAHLPRKESPDSGKIGFWSRLGRELPVRRLAWTHPSELPHVAATILRRESV